MKRANRSSSSSGVSVSCQLPSGRGLSVAAQTAPSLRRCAARSVEGVDQALVVVRLRTRACTLATLSASTVAGTKARVLAICRHELAVADAAVVVPVLIQR
jgi:hypothetical protein